MSSTHVIPVSRQVFIEHTIHIIECATCSVDFGIGADFMRRRREDHQGFFCPNGHSNVYRGDNEAEKLRKQLAREEAARRRAEVRANGEEARRRQADRQRAAAKGQVTRIKNRVSKGVCPCCNRSFENLARHMAGQHPDYASKETS
jgi:hypothetical protein